MYRLPYLQWFSNLIVQHLWKGGQLKIILNFNDRLWSRQCVHPLTWASADVPGGDHRGLLISKFHILFWQLLLSISTPLVDTPNSKSSGNDSFIGEISCDNSYTGSFINLAILGTDDFAQTSGSLKGFQINAQINLSTTEQAWIFQLPRSLWHQFVFYIELAQIFLGIEIDRVLNIWNLPLNLLVHHWTRRDKDQNCHDNQQSIQNYPLMTRHNDHGHSRHHSLLIWELRKIYNRWKSPTNQKKKITSNNLKTQLH